MTADGGFGQMTPTDQVSEYNAITFLVRQLINKISTLMPVQVVSVTNSGDLSPVGSVDVQPLVSLLDGVGNASQHGVVHGIPYFRLQGGTNAIIIDPQVNDIGFIVCADHDISAVKSTKGAANPGSRRRFSLADGIYIGGILNGSPVNCLQFDSQGRVLLNGANGGQVRIGGAGGITITAAPGSAAMTLNGPAGQTIVMDSSGNIVITPGAGTISLGNVTFTGSVSGPGGNINLGATNLTTTGSITSNGKVLATHTHSGVTVGGGVTGPPV